MLDGLKDTAAGVRIDSHSPTQPRRQANIYGFGDIDMKALMKALGLSVLLGHGGLGAAQAADTSPIDYDRAIMLDAEALAEGGIGDAYENVKLSLARYVDTPHELRENLDEDADSYSVTADGKEYPVYGPNLEGGAMNWGRATVVLFSIVNRQLKDKSVKFYALNGGHDLLGIFLTPQEAKAAQASLENPRDWPYIPVMEKGWFGQYH